MKLERFFLSFFLCGLLVTPIFAATSRDAMVDAQLTTPIGVPDPTASDGKARVYAIEGRAVITVQGNPVERDLKVGDEIAAGDAVYTEKGTTLSIAFDNQRQNAVRIPADSKATFTSIEPTDIKLDDGSIFNVVDGLAKGSTWKVTTPSAVAAVRGTTFMASFNDGIFYAATIPDQNNEKNSVVEIQSLTSDNTAEIFEGSELSFKEGDMLSNDLIQELNPTTVAEVQQFAQEVSSDREKASDGESAKGPGGPNGPGGGSGRPGGGPNSPGGGPPPPVGSNPIVFHEPGPPMPGGPPGDGHGPGDQPPLPPRPPIFDNPPPDFDQRLPICGSPGHIYGHPCE